MNTDWMKGNWKQFVGKAKEKWGRLTRENPAISCSSSPTPAREKAGAVATGTLSDPRRARPGFLGVATLGLGG